MSSSAISRACEKWPACAISELPCRDNNIRLHLGWIEGSVPKIRANFQGYKWDGSGTKRGGSGTEVGRRRDGSGTEVGRKWDGSGSRTEAGRKRDGSRTEVGRERDGRGTEVPTEPFRTVLNSSGAVGEPFSIVLGGGGRFTKKMLGVVALAGGRREIHEEKELQGPFHSLQFP